MTTPAAEQRVATVERETGETQVSVTLNLDGTGSSDIQTQIGMLSHMLDQIARHGAFDLAVRVSGDVETGPHHVIEDTAIALGRCLDKALGDRAGIVRMANAVVPLDEALSEVALDLSGRGYAAIDLGSENQVGDFPTSLARHFLESLAVEGRLGLHVRVVAGKNEHHVIESAFKALARALRTAVARDSRSPGAVPSTKGTLT